MKKIIGVIVAALCIVIMVTGCGGGGLIVEKQHRRKPSAGTSWTVMIYMVASDTEENDNRCEKVLDSLSYDLPENINVIVEVGGTDEWNIEGMEEEKLYDFEVQKDGIRSVGEYSPSNMGKASTYSAFLTRTVKRYPADKYVSVILGEGGGPLFGIGADGSYGNDALTPSEIASALAAAETKFDIIGFDGGMQANLETAAMLVPYADYMVASEDVMTCGGWDYRGLFEFLSENPEVGSVEVGREICMGVAERADERDSERVAMSVTDLADITKLMQDFDTLVRAVSTKSEDMAIYAKISSALEGAEYMGANSKHEGYSNLVDLQSFADALYGAAKFDCRDINRSVSKAVVYRTSGSVRKNSCGISVYYPVKYNAEENENYKKICIGPAYAEFIEKIISAKDDDGVSESFQTDYHSAAESFEIAAEPNLNGKYMLKTTCSDIIKSVGVNLYKYNEEKGKYLYLTTDGDVSYNGETGEYEYNLVSRQIELNGIAVCAETVSRSEDMILYSIPVIYDGEESSLRVAASEKDGNREYKVLGIFACGDSKKGIMRREYKMPGVGDNITPIYGIYGEDGEKYAKGKRLTLVFGGLNVKEKKLDDGEYLISYTVTDIYGNDTESNTTNVTAVKGKLQILK